MKKEKHKLEIKAKIPVIKVTEDKDNLIFTLDMLKCKIDLEDFLA